MSSSMQEGADKKVFYASILTWFLASLFYMYQYVLRMMPAVLKDHITEHFHLSAEAFGSINALYYLSYAGLHIPLGLIMQRYGVRKVLPLCILLTVLGTLPLIFSNSVFMLKAGRFVVGLGSSAAALGLIKIAYDLFSKDKVATLLGIGVSIGVVGAMFAGQPTDYLITIFGWHEVVSVICMIGVLLALMIYIILPRGGNNSDATDSGFENVTFSDVWKVVTNPYVLIISIAGGFMIGPMEGFADGWSVELYRVMYHMDRSYAAQLISVTSFGFAVGCATIGMIAEYLKAYFGIAITSASVMGICMTSILLGLPTNSVLYIIMFIIGYMASYQVLLVSVAGNFVEKKHMVLASVVANSIMMGFGYFFHNLIGYLMVWSWDGTMQGEDFVYSLQDYLFGLSSIPIALFIACLMLISLIIHLRVNRNSLNPYAKDSC